MMRLDNNKKQTVTSKVSTISCNRYTSLRCKFILRFTHKFRLAMHKLFKKTTIHEKNKNQLIREALKRDPEIIFFGNRPSILVGNTHQIDIEMYKALQVSADFHHLALQPQATQVKE